MNSLDCAQIVPIKVKYTVLYMYEGGRFIVKLNEASIPTRYPESLANLQRVYSRVVVKDILSKGKELVTWIKQQL